MAPEEADVKGFPFVVALLLTAGPAAAQPRALRIQIANDARISPDFIKDAQVQISRIYAATGIELEFVDGQSDLKITVLSRDGAEKMHHAGDLMGFAPHGDTDRARIAYVLWDRVSQVADGYSAPIAVVLAAAIAHELGHLLLVDGHSAIGVMRPALRQVDLQSARRGRLLFTDRQGAEMRERLFTQASAAPTSDDDPTGNNEGTR